MVIVSLLGWQHRIAQDGMVESSQSGKGWGIRRPDEVGMTDTEFNYLLRNHLKGLTADFPAERLPIPSHAEESNHVVSAVEPR